MKQTDFTFQLRIIGIALEREFNRELEQYGITLRQARFLGYLHGQKDQDKVVTQKELQRYFDISHPTAVGIVQRLVQKGMVKTRQNPEDKRNKIVELTEKEDEIHQKMLALHETLEARLTKGICTEQQQILSSLLEKLYQNIGCRKS